MHSGRRTGKVASRVRAMAIMHSRPVSIRRDTTSRRPPPIRHKFLPKSGTIRRVGTALKKPPV